MLTYLYVQPQKRSQVSRLGTESFIPNGTQKLTEGTGTKNPTFGETNGTSYLSWSQVRL